MMKTTTICASEECFGNFKIAMEIVIQESMIPDQHHFKAITKANTNKINFDPKYNTKYKLKYSKK